MSQFVRPFRALAVSASLVLLAGLLAGAALRPAPAAGQDPAFEEQYELELDSGRSPTTVEPGASPPRATRSAARRAAEERRRGGDRAARAAAVEAAPQGFTAAASGQLPLGGYPLTPLVVLLLTLLLGGLAMRAVQAVRERLGGRRS